MQEKYTALVEKMDPKKRRDNRKSGNLPPLQPIIQDQGESPEKDVLVEDINDSKIESELVSMDQKSSAIDLNNELL